MYIPKKISFQLLKVDCFSPLCPVLGRSTVPFTDLDTQRWYLCLARGVREVSGFIYCRFTSLQSLQGAVSHCMFGITVSICPMCIFWSFSEYWGWHPWWSFSETEGGKSETFRAENLPLMRFWTFSKDS